jgi:hypothetical protein
MGELVWKEIRVCKACQAKYPEALFPLESKLIPMGHGTLNMGFGESAIAAVNWQALEILGGTADDLPAALLALFRSTTHAEAEQVWWKSFENKVFAQNTIYGAAEATVNVLLAALADERPRLVKVWIIELLFFLLNGGSDW